MKARAVLPVVFLLLSASALFAYDFGAVLDNASSYGNQQTPSFSQKDKLSLWFTSGIGENLTFTGSASVQVWNVSPWFIFNPDLLNLTGNFPKIQGGPTLFSFTIGRYQESDFTGLVFSGQSIDGFALGFTYPGAAVTVDLGYTGLTQKPLSYISMTQADAAAQGNSSIYFGSPRVLGRLQVLLPGLFLRQDLTLTALFQQDLRSVFSGSNLIQPGSTTLVYGQGGSLDSEYLGAGLSGSIVENLYYKTYLYLETGRTLSYVTDQGSYQYEPILALLAGGGARYYLDTLLHSTFGLDFLYASGDSRYSQVIEGDTGSGYATAFVPVTSPPRLLSLAFSPNVENIIAATFSYSIRPFAGAKSPELGNLQAVVKAIPMLRPTTGAVAAAEGLAPGAVSPSLPANLTNLYLGSEFDMIVNYRPFSDLGVVLQGGLFAPNPNVFADSAAIAYVELDVSLSF
ncbi:MAG: hypothetical protein ABSG38_17390 [Spirochaetia bacterium]|jgi:hypothetical protein